MHFQAHFLNNDKHYKQTSISNWDDIKWDLSLMEWVKKHTKIIKKEEGSIL